MSKTMHNEDNHISSLFKSQFPIAWSMSTAEQAVLIQTLQNLNPSVSIEIGTYNGGSLQALSKYSKKVYAIDLTADYRDERCNEFDNVEFVIGDSREVLPSLIERINQSDEVVEFVLIDGDHSTEGVLSDITNVLKLVPKQPVLIVLHDSFNPDCRKGIKSYDYSSNNHVHSVELDYVTGLFNHDGLYREMWGGFATISLKPEQREHIFSISAYQDKLYKITYFKSIHFFRKFFWFLKPIYKVFKK